MADLSGELKKTDQILFVNNVDLRKATHAEAANILRNSGENVSLIVNQNPEKFREFERNLEKYNQEVDEANARNAAAGTVTDPSQAGPSQIGLQSSSSSKAPSKSTAHASNHQLASSKANSSDLNQNLKSPNSQNLKNEPFSNSSLQSANSLGDTIVKRTVIKVLFNFNPEIDSQIPARGMTLRFGDILLIIDSDNDEWWRVKRLNDPQEESLIPSISRLEQKCNSKYRSVHFIKSLAGNSNSSGRLTLAPDASQSAVLLPDNKDQYNANNQNILTYKIIQDYEIVKRSRSKPFVPRPIIIVGPFRLELSANLVRSMPELFQYPLPHTSRPRRESEINGVKYHFDTKQNMMEHHQDFVEIGEHKGNLYGVSLESVANVIDLSKHAPLDCSAAAVRRLSVNFHVPPLCILIRPDNLQTCSKITNGDRLEEMRGEMQRAEQAETFMYGLVTARINKFDDYGSLVDQVYNAIKVHSNVLVSK